MDPILNIEECKMASVDLFKWCQIFLLLQTMMNIEFFTKRACNAHIGPGHVMLQSGCKISSICGNMKHSLEVSTHHRAAEGIT
jgi:hypothetical protein